MLILPDPMFVGVAEAHEHAVVDVDPRLLGGLSRLLGLLELAVVEVGVLEN